MSAEIARLGSDAEPAEVARIVRGWLDADGSRDAAVLVTTDPIGLRRRQVIWPGIRQPVLAWALSLHLAVPPLVRTEGPMEYWTGTRFSGCTIMILRGERDVPPLTPRPDVSEPRDIVMRVPAGLVLVGLDEGSATDPWQCYLRWPGPTGSLRRGTGSTAQEAIDDAERALRATQQRLDDQMAEMAARREAAPAAGAARAPSGRHAGETDEERRARRKARRAARKERQAAAAVAGVATTTPQDEEDDDDGDEMISRRIL